MNGSYGGVNYTYANDIEYRAWGAVKRHGTKTITYNNRLQPTQFRHFQNRYDYNYHPDGRLKQLIDLDDMVGAPSQVTFHYMSRSYGYDLAGRISRVDGTDNPIINGGVVPPPFAGYYGYDEFDNLISRSGHYALNASTSDSGTFVDNKRTNTGWTYDVDGRLLTSVDTATNTSQTWSYDAAGNQIGISEVSSGATTTDSLKYDGDGELLYDSVTTPQTTKANYLIRSTVLGTVLTKLDASGNKDITYVPTNGLAFPLQTKDFNGNPTVTGVSQDVTGLQEDGKAVDPFGAQVMNVQPPDSTEEQANMHVFGPPYSTSGWSTFTNANNFSSGCTLDGVRTSCSKVAGAISAGMVGKLLLSTTGLESSFANLGIFITKSPVPSSTSKTPPRWRQPTPNPQLGNQNPYGIGANEIQYLTQISFSLTSFGMLESQDTQVGETNGGKPDHCAGVAQNAQVIADHLKAKGITGSRALHGVDARLSKWYVGQSMKSFVSATVFYARLAIKKGDLPALGATLSSTHWGTGGFPDKFLDSVNPEEDQTHHLVAFVSAGINDSARAANMHANWDAFQGNDGDVRLSKAAFSIGQHLRKNPNDLSRIGEIIYTNICKGKAKV